MTIKAHLYGVFLTRILGISLGIDFLTHKKRLAIFLQNLVIIMERETGIEPATSSLGSLRSTTELLPLIHLNIYGIFNSKKNYYT